LQLLIQLTGTHRRQGFAGETTEKQPWANAVLIYVRSADFSWLCYSNTGRNVG
jgi:hypothetical protein